MNRLQRFFHTPFFIKLLHWEYWSMPVVYLPTYFGFAWLCIRSGCKYFFVAANPRIKYGGFLMESKKEIYDMMPQQYYPKTIFFKGGTDVTEVLESLYKNQLSFPLIAKPDIGMKGYAVKKIDNEDGIRRFIPRYNIDFLLQEFVPYQNEVGIFYSRYPGQAMGKISGIVAKEFLEVTGDGKKTLLQLLQSDKRFVLQIESLRKEYYNSMNEVPAAGKKIQLVPYGNHARGAKFLDHSHLADEQLTELIDDFCKQVPEFWFGRLDIRYNNWNELRNGKNFSVIELNGAGSEPTHMYDPRHSLFFAWKEITRHHKILYQISRLNKRRGYPFMSWSEGQKMFRDSRSYSKKLKAVHEALLHA